MAHESFEDDETAAYMNEHFVNIKVDREERPDVDRVYMDAVTATTGSGGWPMTVFLTPQADPFYAGTYFPKDARHGMPSFAEVLNAVSGAWANDRESLVGRSLEVSQAISERASEATTRPSDAEMGEAVDRLAASFDPRYGGFGRAPKFPQPSTLEYLLRFAALRPGDERASTALGMIEVTLDRMARGGIYDHLDGGFARYSVDERWLAPHFEKMLYDNALLSRLYLRAWQVTGHRWMLETAIETLDYLSRDMADPSGGIHSAEDADAGGVEGGFSVWTWDELGDTLGSDLDLGAAIYGAAPEGNFEGTNILHLPQGIPDLAVRLRLDEAELRSQKRGIDDRLRRQRATRERPFRDDKIVTAWNGFALRAFSEAAGILGESRYLTAARGIAAFITGPALDGDRLLRSRRGGRPGPAGFCDDYASAALGLFSLYQATGEERWYVHAEHLARVMIERFSDDAGGFYATAADEQALIARPKNFHDNPTPSDNALAAEALAILAAYTGEADLYDRSEATIRSAGPGISTQPAVHGHLLGVSLSSPLREVAIVGPSVRRRPFIDAVWGEFRPDAVIAEGDGRNSAVPLMDGRGPSGRARAFVCRGFVCDLPADSVADMRDQLRGA